MRHAYALQLLLLAIAGVPTLAAQTPVELIGMTDQAPALVVRRDRATCAASTCATTWGAIGGQPIGGSAYDATRAAVWVSEGALVQAVDPTTCATVCPPHSLPALQTPVTGLAIQDAMGLLVVSDASNTISQYRLQCPIQQRVSQCAVLLPLGHQIGGIATDDVADLVIYATSNTSGLPANNTVVIAPRSDPCTPICSFAVPTCGGQPMDRSPESRTTRARARSG